MKSNATNLAEVTATLRSKAEEQLLAKGAAQVETETSRLLHELRVRHVILEMQNAELRLAKDTAESDKIDVELLLAQSKITELVLSENKLLLEQLNEALERRVCEGVTQLRRQDKMLLSQNRQAAMGEMISCIAHQWRQPLNILGLSIQQLPMYQELGRLDKELIDKTVKNTMEIIQYLSHTIDDFRNFFMPNKEIELFDVNKAVDSAVCLTKDSLKHHNIVLDSISQGDLFINGYPNEYSQVVLNVIMNAQDALLEQKIEQPLITVTLSMENEKSVVTITDNAGGIPEQYLEHIFEPYFTTKGANKGTGIGLYMAKTIIEKHMRGKLTVRNSNGGAEFRIEV